MGFQCAPGHRVAIEPTARHVRHRARRTTASFRRSPASRSRTMPSDVHTSARAERGCAPRRSGKPAAPRRPHPRNVLRTPPDLSPDLDHWLPDPTMRVAHRRETSAPPDRLWDAARSVRLSDARLLGRLVRWRIPGLAPDLAFDELFRAPPFTVLAEDEGRALVVRAGRADLDAAPRLSASSATPRSSATGRPPGTARVVFANWIEDSARTAPRSTPRCGSRRSAPRAGSGWRRSARSSALRKPDRQRRDRGRGPARRDVDRKQLLCNKPIRSVTPRV